MTIISKIYCFIVIFISLISCHETELKTKYAEQYIIDSFELKILDYNDVCAFINFTNDSVINSFSYSKNIIETYNCINNYYSLDSNKNIAIDYNKTVFFFTKIGNEYYITDSKNNWTIVNEITKKQLELKRTAELPFIGNNYRLGYNRLCHLLKVDNKLYCQYSIGLSDSTIDENIIASFIPNKVTIDSIQTYLLKPKAIFNYLEKQQMYATNCNKIVVVFPCFDTIYNFNTRTGLVNKIVIGNKKFKLPAKAFLNPIDSNYFSDLSKYGFDNFNYLGIQFNPSTKHFVLYFTEPVSEIKDRNLLDTDQPLQAVILNEDFKILEYVKFKTVYEIPYTFIVHPSKGIAIPLMKDKNTNVKTFYYFNF